MRSSASAAPAPEPRPEPQCRPPSRGLQAPGGERRCDIAEPPAKARKVAKTERDVALGFRRCDFGRASGDLQCAVADTLLRKAIPALQRTGAGASRCSASLVFRTPV